MATLPTQRPVVEAIRAYPLVLPARAQFLSGPRVVPVLVTLCSPPAVTRRTAAQYFGLYHQPGMSLGWAHQQAAAWAARSGRKGVYPCSQRSL